MAKRNVLTRLMTGAALALAMFTIVSVKLQAVTVTITASAVCDPTTGAFRISYTASQAQSYAHANPSVNISFDGVVVDNGAFTLPGLSFSDTLNAPAGKGAGDIVTVSVDVVGMYDNGVQPGPGDVTDSTTVTLPEGCTPPEVGGCTPGYWKASQHFDSWEDPYDPTDLFNDLPGFADAFPGLTLLQVLSLNGGGLNALGRHTVAALLNSAGGFGVDLPALQLAFNAAIASGDYEPLKDLLDALNNQGCPLD
jgi:hypothetical protein